MITSKEYYKYIKTLEEVCDIYDIHCSIRREFSCSGDHDDVTVELYGSKVPIYHENIPSTRGTIERFKNPSFHFDLRDNRLSIENLITSTKTFFTRYLKLSEIETTKKLWEELLMKTFTKKDLKNGDFVVLRNGMFGAVIVDTDTIVLDSNGFMDVSVYGDNLINTPGPYGSGAKDFDIMKVYRGCRSFRQLKTGLHSRPIYDRELNEVEEMTLEEVCKALGKNIKIVKGE